MNMIAKCECSPGKFHYELATTRELFSLSHWMGEGNPPTQSATPLVKML